MKHITCSFCGDAYPDFDVAHVCSKGPYSAKLEFNGFNECSKNNKSPKDYDELIERIAISYAVKIYHIHEDCGKNRGLVSVSGREIFLGIFDDPDIKLVAFFHELGHILSHTVCKQDTSVSIILAEGLAWEIGFGIARDFGFKYKYDSKEMIWAREQLKTYIDGESYKELERTHDQKSLFARQNL